MRVALDSNILAYQAGVARSAADEAKIVRVRLLLDQLTQAVTLIAPVQALGELFVVLQRSGRSAADARDILRKLVSRLAAPASEPRTALAAADLAVDHKLQYWDAMILSGAAEAGSSILLSEDMQHGFVLHGLTVINPLAEPMHPKLAALMKGGDRQ